MNKKLLTAAIGAALAAGPMLAQADVKLYGKVHVSVDYLDAKGVGSSGAAGSTTEATASTSRKQTNVSSNSSRWGIDVSEKLGGGMTGIAKLESEIDASGETASQNTRNRYVGLSGKFGQIIAGTVDTPLKDVSRAVEFFPEYVGDNRNLLRQKIAVAGTNTSVGWDERPPNSIMYTTPSFNGFSASYLYSADSSGVTGLEDNRRRVSSLGLKYTKGPLYVAYAYETHRFNTITDSGNPTESGTRLGASYNFGAFKVGAVYQDLKDIGGTDIGDSSIKRKSWALGGAYTAGNNVFKVQYAKADDLSNNSAGASQPETGATMWALGWDHLFSKTVKGYVAYAKTDNGANAQFTVNGGGHGDELTPGRGGDPTAWSIGMIVDF